MLAKNFPGRKDARRREAIVRLETIKEPKATVLAAIEATKAKLVDGATELRTKKRRGV